MPLLRPPLRAVERAADADKDLTGAIWAPRLQSSVAPRGC